jgi:hypothetical protein
VPAQQAHVPHVDAALVQHQIERADELRRQLVGGLKVQLLGEAQHLLDEKIGGHCRAFLELEGIARVLPVGDGV